MHRRNINEPGHAHELTFSCFHRHPFLNAERTCRWLADAIDSARQRLSFELWAYVFMPDHVHLIVRPCVADYDIARIRRAIKSPVARKAIAYLEQCRSDWLPRITRERGGHTERLFWQSGGGYDRNITGGRTLCQMVDYLHHNPVRAGLVARAADWKWSSAAWFVSSATIPLSVDPIPPDWLEDVPQ